MNTKLAVIGGCYWESCEIPSFKALRGSGGRAAYALSSVVPNLDFYTAFPESFSWQLAELRESGVCVHLHDVPNRFAFSYLHPLSTPVVFPAPPSKRPQFSVSCETVLQFGMIDADAIVRAGTAVFDPQQAKEPAYYTASGSKSDRLALVVNSHEALAMTGASDLSVAATRLLEQDSASVLVVKRGPAGASVFDKKKSHFLVPAYRSDVVFKIGSGDIFSAAFAYFWGVQRMPPETAADLASRSVSIYCNDPSSKISAEPQFSAPASIPVVADDRGVLVVASTRTLCDKWLLDQVRWHLGQLGAASTVLDVDCASGDISLDHHGPILVLFDGVQRERVRLNIPASVDRLLVFSETEAPTGLPGKAFVSSDLCSVLYHVCWKAEE